MHNLVVSKIERSIDLMDEFENGDYDYLELQHWFWVSDRHDREYSFSDNSGRFHINLLISKTKEKTVSVCKYEPTMTELRQMQHHGICLDSNYAENSIDGILRDACRTWKKDILIPLREQICLRAQTSWNRMDYGCEWLGGGDWEEKTLYGDTTDFFITAIYLREPHKSTEQEAREILDELRALRDENNESIMNILTHEIKSGMVVRHKKYGEGLITQIGSGKCSVEFRENRKIATFIFPSAVLEGYFDFEIKNSKLQMATDLWQNNKILSKEIKVFEVAMNLGDFLEIFRVVYNHNHKDRGGF